MRKYSCDICEEEVANSTSLTSLDTRLKTDETEEVCTDCYIKVKNQLEKNQEEAISLTKEFIQKLKITAN